MKGKRFISIFLVIAMTALLFTGCGGKKPDNGDSGKKSDTKSKPVVYWCMWNASETQGKVIGEAVEAFEKETGIDVDIQFKGRKGVREELQSALNANMVVDLFDEDLDRININFANYIADLEDLMKTYDCEENYIPRLISQCRESGGGTLKTIPYQPFVFAFYYNKDVFKEAGVTKVPETWDEFLDTCEKIKQAGYIPISCDACVYLAYFFGYHLGRLVGEDRIREIVVNGEWDDPAVLKTAQAMRQLWDLGYFSPNLASNVWPEAQIAELGSGKSAMYLNGTWLPNEIRDTTGPDFNWGCFNYPAVEGGKYGTEAINYGAQVFAINKKSEVKDEAFQLIRYLTTGEVDAKLSAETWNIPIDIHNTEWPSQVADIKPILENASVRWTYGVSMEYNSDISPDLLSNVISVSSGDITPEEFVSNMLTAAGK